MATENTLARLKETLGRLSEVDMDLVKRRSLGDQSLSQDMGGVEKELDLIIQQAEHYSVQVHDDVIRAIIANLMRIATALEQQAALGDDEYIGKKEAFIGSLQVQIEESKRWRSEIARMLMLNLSVVEVERLGAAVQEVKDKLDQSREGFFEEVRAECNSMLSKASGEAEEIVSRARRTARHISVKEAQRQFEEAAEKGAVSAKRWSWIVAGSFGALIVTILFLLFLADPPRGEGAFSAESVYFTLMRLFLLSTLASFSAFTFKMLRVHLHMAEKNRHRVRVANSVEGFVQSAGEPSQRDLILAKMTDAIVSFGDSGLVQHDREDGSSTMSNDLVGRVAAALSGKN